MQNFLKKISFEKIKNNLKESFQRFPISFVSVILFFGILEFMIIRGNTVNQFTEMLLLKVNLTLVIIYFLGIGVKLFLESRSCDLDKKIKCFFGRNLIKFSPVILGIIFFFNFEENLLNNFFFEELLYIFISILGVISFVFISKFIFLEKGEKGNFFQNFFNSNSEKLENEKYFLFFSEKTSKIFLSVFLGISLMILGFIAVWSVFTLFEIGKFFDQGKIFASWAAFSLSFFAPIYFLGIVSKDEKIEIFETISEDKFYNFFLKFLALPAIILYFLILYSYSIKVLLDFGNWPNGTISWLIILFSFFGYLAYVLSFVLQEKSRFVEIFRKFFPFAVLFQIPMFFYAIYLRIAQYDFTINRYLLLVFGIYLLLISLYFIFSKAKNLKNIFVFLVIFIFFISVSSNFSVYKFPENRQLNILEENLVQVGILKDGEIFLPEKYEDINSGISGEIYDRISYLCDFHGCDVLSKFFPEIIEEIKKDDFENWEKNRAENIERFSKAIEEHGDEIERTEINKVNLEREKNAKYTGINSRVFREKIFEKLKVRSYFLGGEKNRKYISLAVKYDLRREFYEIKNYDYFTKILNIHNEEKFPNPKENYGEFYSKFSSENGKILVYKGDYFEEFEISEEIKNFYEKNKNQTNQYGEIELEENFISEKKGNKFDVKIILQNFYVENPEYNGVEKDFYNYVDGVVLIREK